VTEASVRVIVGGHEVTLAVMVWTFATLVGVIYTTHLYRVARCDRTLVRERKVNGPHAIEADRAVGRELLRMIVNGQMLLSAVGSWLNTPPNPPPVPWLRTAVLWTLVAMPVTISANAYLDAIARKRVHDYGIPWDGRERRSGHDRRGRKWLGVERRGQPSSAPTE
jgi:hypothetical protein